MYFAQASELARRTPGAVLTRAEDGTFVVLLNGRRLHTDEAPRSSETQPSTNSASHVAATMRVAELEAELRIQSESHRLSVQNLMQSHEQQLAELKDELAAKQHEVNRVNHLCDTIRRQAVDLGAQVDELRNENAALSAKLEALQRKMALIPLEDWEALTASLAASSAAVAEEQRSVRRVVKCSCLGEAEGCFKCGGSGSYTVDGFGNIV